MGEPRAARYARKFYPWYLERLGIRGAEANALQRTETLEEARVLADGPRTHPRARRSGRLSRRNRPAIIARLPDLRAH